MPINQPTNQPNRGPHGQVFGSAAAAKADTATLAVEPARPGSELSARLNAVLAELRRGHELYQVRARWSRSRMLFSVRARACVEEGSAFGPDPGPGSMPRCLPRTPPPGAGRDFPSHPTPFLPFHSTATW